MPLSVTDTEPLSPASTPSTASDVVRVPPVMLSVPVPLVPTKRLPAFQSPPPIVAVPLPRAPIRDVPV